MLANSESRRIFCRKINSDGVSQAIGDNEASWSSFKCKETFLFLLVVTLGFFCCTKWKQRKITLYTRDYPEVALCHKKIAREVFGSCGYEI